MNANVAEAKQLSLNLKKDMERKRSGFVSVEFAMVLWQETYDCTQSQE